MKGVRRVVIPSNKGLPCRCHPFDLIAHDVQEVVKLEDRRRWGEEDGIEERLRAAAGIGKYRQRFR